MHLELKNKVNKSKILVYLIEDFSSDTAEQFFEPELPYLSEAFKEVHIFPLVKSTEIKVNLPSNVKVHYFDFYQPYNRIVFCIKNFFLIFKLFLFQITISQNRINYLLRFKKYFNHLLHHINSAQNLEKVINKFNAKDTIFYSYWFNVWVFLLSLVKYNSKEKFKIIARAHGGDYDEDQRGHFIPFRAFQMSQVDAVIPVSDYGVRYLKKRYPAFQNLLKKSHLGVVDRGMSPYEPGNFFHLVSCSSIIPLKRLNLIVDILKSIGFPLTWTHFGDGPLKEEILLSTKDLPPNITVNFKGHCPNNFVIEFYKINHVDLLINVSVSEGIPVSMMEAISMGIPLIGTNVGGVAEIVTPKTGFLIPSDFNVLEVSKIIKEYYKDRHNKKEFRNTVKDYWSQNFSLEKNYDSFVNQLLVQI